jgi:hypothetical protein
MNELNLMFGPKMPQELESVGLAFIAAPTLSPDSAIAALSAERYAKENYSHLAQNIMFREGEAGKQLKLDIEIPPISGFTNPTGLGSYSISTSVDLSSTDWMMETLNTAIRVAGMHISKAGTWCPIVKPGTVYRPYKIVRSREPEDSWLLSVLNGDEEDAEVLLVYSVPEYRYGIENTTTSIKFPPNSARFKTVREVGFSNGPHKIGYSGDLYQLLEVKINGVVQFSGTYTGVEEDTYLRGIDFTVKLIDVSKALGPEDLIELKYLSYADYHVYTGYRDASGTWFPFDANPEFGHIIGDPTTRLYRNSAEVLLEQITLYALPTAAIKLIYTSESSSTYVGHLKLRFYRASAYGETHFVRHIVSSETTEEISARDGGTVINTWGYALFGRNFYDEQNVDGGDIFDSKIPSMLPLGRFVLAAPASVRSVSVADIRQRGGGVPLDFPMIGVETQENGLDKLRSFLDMGIWEGKAIKEGGVIEIEIDRSLLKTDEDDPDPNTFLSSEIYELVKKQVPPGIDFEIRFIEM